MKGRDLTVRERGKVGPVALVQERTGPLTLMADKKTDSVRKLSVKKIND